MATLHIMVGLPCSGKTTRAKQLEQELRALRLTPDEWQIRLLDTNAITPGHDRLHDEVERIMWDVAKRALELGANVILDFGLWAREERDDFRRRAKDLGVGYKLHYMHVSEEELLRRLHLRNQEAPPGAFVIPDAEMRSFMRIFQPPTQDELM